MNNENIILAERVKRGRPSKAKPVIDLDEEVNKRGRGRPKKETIIDENTEVIKKSRGRPPKEKEVKERVPRGRPRSVDIIDKVEYQKQYYQNNKEKYTGDYTCIHCNLLCSYSNKSRHIKTHHPDII
jgi:hypothetical protein